MNLAGKLAIGGVGAAVLLWAAGASAKGGGGPVAPPHPKPPGGSPPSDEPPPSEPPPGPIDLAPFENNEYPTPGKFYLVQARDVFLGTNSTRSIVWRALLSAGYVAATELGRMDPDAAREFAREFALDPGRRIQFYELILCTAYNDAAYGVWGWNRQLNRAGRHGRAIPLVPSHVDNRTRLAQGLPVGRNMALGEPGDTVSRPLASGHTSYPYLWLPALDLAAVAQGEVTPSDPMDLPVPWSYEAGDLTRNRNYGCGIGERGF